MRRFDGAAVVVTGAAGFLGANLVRALLAEGARVHAFVRPGSRPWRLAQLRDAVVLQGVDVTDAAAVRAAVGKAAPRHLFHLASRSGHPTGPEARRAALRTDVLGTAALLDALEGLPGARLVHFGSSLEYGPRGVPLREDEALAPVTARGASKAAAALLCLQRARTEGLPVSVVRPFSVYGPWEGAARLVPVLMLAALRGAPVDLTGPGIRHDFVHVDDVVEGGLLAMLARDACGEAFNLGTGTQHGNEEIVEAVEQASGRRLEVRHGAFPNRPHDTGHWVADRTRAREVLGWSPRWQLRAGIADTWDWFRAHHPLYAAA